jgi:glycerol kinase
MRSPASGGVVVALDQGTTSTRCMLFDLQGREVGRAQREHRQFLPRPGWVEHDPHEIWENTGWAIAEALRSSGVEARDIVAVGITNQRETTLVWNRRTGQPYGNAIVWQDMRTDQMTARLAGDERGALIRDLAGLPPTPYFSGGKLAWILEHDAQARRDAEAGLLAFGTVDSWLLWHLTGGQHITDVTNASRTMLMNLTTTDWDDRLLAVFGIPRSVLPEIAPSAHADAFGRTRADGPFGAELPIAGVLGDQQAAMVGQVCLSPGEAKNTYGTGNFLLLNTGTDIVRSAHGLLTTVCYQFGDDPPVYALEGSVAVTGSAIQWLRDQLGIISHAAETESFASRVEDSGDVYFVPAFSGLYAPYWRSDARGVILGLSRHSSREHLCRAALEAICYQSRDVADAMAADAGRPLEVLKVDGGVTANSLCMQLQADILGVDVSRPVVAETTALGAAYAAGLAVGHWGSPEELRANWQEDRRWSPRISEDQRERGHRRWQQAVERSLGWVDLEDQSVNPSTSAAEDQDESPLSASSDSPTHPPGTDGAAEEGPRTPGKHQDSAPVEDVTS